MSGFLFETNVLLDISTADPVWLSWSESQFRSCAAQGSIFINPIIYAEMAPAFATIADLDQWLDPAGFQRLPLPYAAGWIAAQACLNFAGAPAGFVRHFAVGRRICGGDQHERGRESHGAGGAGDGDVALFQRLAHGFQDAAFELGCSSRNRTPW